MAKRINALAAKEGAPSVAPVEKDELAGQLRAALVKRFGQDVVDSLPDRRMWPKGRGV